MRPHVVLAASVSLSLSIVSCGSTPGEQADPNADLEVAIAGPGEASAGDSPSYSVTVRNLGPATATNVTVVDRISGPYDFVSSTSSDGSGIAAGDSVVWTFSAIEASGTETISLTLLATEAGELSNATVANSAAPDPDLSNNGPSNPDGTVTTAIASSADISVTFTAPNAALSQTTESLTLVVRNSGPSPASDVRATLVIPAGIQVTNPGGGTPGNGTIVWSLGGMARDSSRTLVVEFTVPNAGPIITSASAQATEPDPVLGNNRGATLTREIIVTFESAWTASGSSAGENLGWVMENIGDVDGDGIVDAAVTAPGFAGNTGRVYVRSGADGSLIHQLQGAEAGEQFGATTDGPGDVDGDGIPDVLVGAPGVGAGKAYVFSGADGSLIVQLNGENAGDNFGIGVGRVGDIDGDGLNDVLVGATGYDGGGFTDNGRVYVYSSATWTTIWTHESLANNSNFGQALAGLEDTNGDGVPEVLVGASRGPGGGRIYAFDGATGQILFPSIGALPGSGQLALFWLESMGDIDGDGVSDFFSSDISHTARGAGTGRAYIFSGADGSVIRSYDGEKAGDNFGIGRTVDDVDGDGLRDLFVAAWLSDEGASNAGKAYVYSSGTGELLRTFSSVTPSDNLGFDAIGMGDVNGDGLTDFLISGGLSQTTPGTAHLVLGIPTN